MATKLNHNILSFYGTFVHVPDEGFSIRINRATYNKIKHVIPVQTKHKRPTVHFCNTSFFSIPEKNKSYFLAVEKSYKIALMQRYRKCKVELYLGKQCEHCGSFRGVITILRTSNRLNGIKKQVSCYNVLKKEECCICRTKQIVQYQCDTCNMKVCHTCKIKCQKRNFDCPGCRTGMLPYGWWCN